MLFPHKSLITSHDGFPPIAYCVGILIRVQYSIFTTWQLTQNNYFVWGS